MKHYHESNFAERYQTIKRFLGLNLQAAAPSPKRQSVSRERGIRCTDVVNWANERKSFPMWIHLRSHPGISRTLAVPKSSRQYMLTHFADDIFKRIFFNEDVWISIKISLTFVARGPINNISDFSIGSDNGLAPFRQQAIIWTNDG